MGCINSTKKISELRVGTGNNIVANNVATHDAANVFRVRAVRLQPDMPDMPMCRNGYLELTPREIIFSANGSGGSSGNQHAPIVWSLQHLRRYGVNGEIFSFEAGRRCMTGPGIFSFRLPEAEPLHQLFQRYINDVSTLTDDVFQFHGQANEHASSYSLARTNNYLEPTNAQRSAAVRSEYFGSSSPMDLDSPDSLPSLSFGANEVVHFANNSRYTPQIQAAAEQLSLQTTGNIYSERPVGSQQQNKYPREHNNNNYNRSECSIYGGVPAAGVESGTVSAFSTMSRKLLVRRSSMDMPPKECAPLLTPTSPTLRLYANIERWADGQMSMAADCCYENLNRSDFPLLLPPNNNATNNSAMANNSNPTTPGGATTISRMASIADPESMSLGSGGEQSISGTATTSGTHVNYIVLDLDQPRSPATAGSQYSPKTPFGSAFSISAVEDTEEIQLTQDNNETTMPPYLRLAEDTASDKNIKTTTTTIMLAATTTTQTTTAATTNNTNTISTNSMLAVSGHEQQQQHQLDYSTIDFVKTCALIKSTVNGMDFDVDADLDVAEEESRITRHSKCVRKAYSISE